MFSVLIKVVDASSKTFPDIMIIILVTSVFDKIMNQESPLREEI